MEIVVWTSGEEVGGGSSGVGGSIEGFDGVERGLSSGGDGSEEIAGVVAEAVVVAGVGVPEALTVAEAEVAVSVLASAAAGGEAGGGEETAAAAAATEAMMAVDDEYDVRVMGKTLKPMNGGDGGGGGGGGESLGECEWGGGGAKSVRCLLQLYRRTPVSYVCM